MAEKQTKAEKKTTAGSTQAYLNISEVKDGVVVLKDGTLRAVLMTSALNFALKSGQEQDAIIYGYQRFLNSLTFPVQILVQSRQLDLDYYIERLTKRASEEPNELIKLQTLEYAEFIKRLISVTNIMDKRFFIVVPFHPEGLEPLKGFGKLFATSQVQKQRQAAAEEQFAKSKVQLMQRVEALAGGLGAMGIRAATLNSEELVELFYSIYNPSTATKQRLINVDELTAASITSTQMSTPAPPTAETAQTVDKVKSAMPAEEPAQPTAPDQTSSADTGQTQTGENHG